MTFDVFSSLSDEQLKKKNQATDEYLRRRALIFDVFNTPKGRELLALMRSVTVDRPFKLSSPKSADEQVAFLASFNKKDAVDGFVKQILTQIRQEEQARAGSLNGESHD